MNYNVPKGYVIVSEKSRELAKKFNLDEDKENALYRELLKEAKKEGRKYNDNPNSRIWLLNENIDEEYILKKIDPYFGQDNLIDMVEETKEENSNKKTISLIKDIIDSGIETDKCLEIIRALVKNN
ncbi:MAG: hypothetical protein H9W81_14950 [Enterococcus sp.]|nr:hypothetical protein [Enterococcus sp.]